MFEGIDGSGKSTLLQSVSDEIVARGLETLFPGRFGGLTLLREPTDLPSGRRIKEILQSPQKPRRSEWLECFLADRAENVTRNIRPLKEEGHLILQDRYFFSTAAYQGDFESPPGPGDIVQMNRDRGFPEPDLLLFLDISAEAALERIKRSRGQLETFENLEFLRKLRRRYQAVLPDNAILLDASLNVDELVRKTLAAIG